MDICCLKHQTTANTQHLVQAACRAGSAADVAKFKPQPENQYRIDFLNVEIFSPDRANKNLTLPPPQLQKKTEARKCLFDA
jgi:hypothetical protein